MKRTPLREQEYPQRVIVHRTDDGLWQVRYRSLVAGFWTWHAARRYATETIGPMIREGWRP